MSDRELLELAAKAVGIELAEWSEIALGYRRKDGGHWNPLTDDVDAFRLMEKLKIDSIWDDDRKLICSAWRRAIVRAAAEIGRNMK